MKWRLLIKGKQGYIDRFRNRIIFPICDHLGRFVGFGGRSIDGQMPKYMNSPQTAVFNKGAVVYGLNWSKDIIKKENEVIIVEGYTDYIGLAARGKKNVVASLGTAFTPRHARLLKRFAEHAVIAYDGDASGQKATLRSMSILHEHGLEVRVALLAAGQDPDSFARAHTNKEISEWLAQAVPLRQYEIDTVIAGHDVKTREGKLAASTELVTILAQLKKAVERDEYTRYAAEKLGVSLSALALDVQKKAGISSHTPVRSRHTNRSMPKMKISPADVAAERDIIRWLLFKPEVLRDLQKEKILPADFHHRDYRYLYSLILSQQTDEEGALITARLFELGELKGSWQEYFQSFLIVLRRRRLEKIEEKLSSLENDREGFDIRMELYRLLKEYYSVLSSTRND
ncbi:MAG TPA: toprim domain-containing protein [Firmicutes bacterium]|nr:toprim domain-containing protein [Bacillota bacterium]